MLVLNMANLTIFKHDHWSHIMHNELSCLQLYQCLGAPPLTVLYLAFKKKNRLYTPRQPTTTHAHSPSVPLPCTHTIPTHHHTLLISIFITQVLSTRTNGTNISPITVHTLIYFICLPYILSFGKDISDLLIRGCSTLKHGWTMITTTKKRALY